MTTVQLSSVDARLAYLAVRYHLARPGSELDQATGMPAAHGLRELDQSLAPQLDNAVATIELTGEQRKRLVSALAGAINELKSTALLAAGGQSTVPSFRGALRRLFPEAAGDPEEATQLAGRMLALRRRLEQLAIEPAPGGEEQPRRRSRWRFWRRD